MNYGFETSRKSRVGKLASLAFGIVTGFGAGLLVTLVVFALAATLRAAYPPWAWGVPAVLELVSLALVGAAVVSIPARRADSSVTARTMGRAAAATVAILVAGGLTGLIEVEGVHVPFFLIPAVPTSPAGAPGRH